MNLPFINGIIGLYVCCFNSYIQPARKVIRMEKLTTLHNIGEEMEAKLISVGIHCVEEFVQVGSKEAYARLKVRYANVCLVHLYTLQGAIDGIEFHKLSDEMKRNLKQFSEQLK